MAQEASAAFQYGVQAFQERDYAAAVRYFQNAVKQQPNSPVAQAALAFLADATALAGRTDASRSEAINVYRVLIRDYPGTPNAVRAEWRVGDLYNELGWHHEALATYERAAAHAQSGYDADRALLGQGVTFMALEKWREAEQALDTLRRRTADEGIVMRATLGTATALYQQGRIQEAQPLFDFCYRRWPAFVKRDPGSLLRFASTLFETGRLHLARHIYSTFYNLYPRHADAPSALVSIGDTFQKSGLRHQAEIFYTSALTLYPGTPTEPLAKLRLVQLGLEAVADAEGNLLRLTVESAMRGEPAPYLDPAEQRETLRTIAARYADNVLASEALFRLGEHYESAGDRMQAIQAYQDVTKRSGRIEGDPWPETAASRIATILRPWMEAAFKAGDDLTAVTLFHRHGALADRVYLGQELLLNVADAHRRLGFTAQATRLYQTILREPKGRPFLEQALIGLGRTYLAQHDPAAARKVFERYRLQFPVGRSTPEALGLLVKAMRQQGDRSGAIRVCRRWLRLYERHPDRPDMLILLARTLAEAGKSDEALLVYEEAWRTGSFRDAAALLEFGDLLAKVQQYDRAVGLYRQVLAARPRPDQAQWARLQLGRIQLMQKNYREAESLFKQVGAVDDPLMRRVSTTLLQQIRPRVQKKGR
ncbi:MAG: tetratricopeptide repeat protein [Nitrospirota bacterium]